MTYENIVYRGIMLVYMATNIINGKRYIGCTSKDTFINRKYAHHKAVIAGSKNPFHLAIKKYGKENIKWEILEEGISEWDVVTEREKYWIKEYNTFKPNGYNLTLGGEGAFGHVVSEEAKNKMGLANIGNTYNKGRLLSEETKKKIADANRGHKMTEEQRKHITEINRQRGLARIGVPRSLETIEKMRKAATGVIVSEETRLKLSKVHKGRLVSDATREKIRTTRLGTHHTEETKSKIRAAKLGSIPWNLGVSPSENTKEKIRLAHIGKTQSEETCAKRSASMMGHVGWNTGPHSEETKKKIGDALRGRVRSVEQRKNYVEAWKVRKLKKELV